MLERTWCVAAVVLVLSLPPALAAKDPDEKFWAAVRKGNVAKVARFLERGVTPDSRIVALSVSVSGNRHETFDVLWSHDNSDISSEAIDYALCYAYRNPVPVVSIQTALNERSLAIDACCERNSKQPYCARRPVKLTDREFPVAECGKVFTEEAQVPPGATRIAVLWDERVAVLEQASTARYGPHKISKAGAKDWAMELAPALGALGADAILITLAETNVASSSSVTRYAGQKGEPVIMGAVFGTVTDRIEIVGIRTIPLD